MNNCYESAGFPTRALKGQGLISAFMRHASLRPSAPALRFQYSDLSYAEVARRSETVMRSIIASGVRPGESVGICVERSFEMIVAVLGVLRAGAAYVPLDPTYPRARLELMVRDSGVSLLVGSSAQDSFLKAMSESTGCKQRILDQEEHFSKSSPIEIETSTSGTSGDSEPAYVIFTSGSTGTPKGVVMPHGPLVRLIEWQNEVSSARGIGSGSRTLQFAPLSFDVSFQEIFSTLTTGGTLVLIDADSRLDGRALARLVQEDSINRLYLPVVALQYLAEAVAIDPALAPGALKEVITAGEALKVTPAIRSFFQSVKGCSLVNQYGPSETHVVTAFDLEGDSAAWPELPPIGAPLPYVSVRVGTCHESGWIFSSSGDAGELLLGGQCVATGYSRRPDLTAEKFIEIEIQNGIKERFYRTGDLVRVGADSMIEFLGRADDQVKIRGYRVELGEIEAALLSHPALLEAAVSAVDFGNGGKEVAAHVVWRHEPVSETTLRDHLSLKLADYMIPSFFVTVPSLPKTPSGKIDRKALPRPESNRPRPDLDTPFVAARTNDEKSVSQVWRELLRLESIGVNDNLFELGATSILAVRSIGKLRSLLGRQADLVTPASVFRGPTVAGIASLLSGSDDGALSRLRQSIERQSAAIHGAADDGIAIIGMAGRFPGAPDIETLWNNLKAGKDGISRFTDSELDPSIARSLADNPDYVKARGIIEGADTFDAAFFGIGPVEAEVMDPQQRVFLEVSWEALEDSGYAPGTFKGAVGVFAGTGNNTYYFKNILSRPDLLERVGEFQAMVGNEKDYVATRVSHKLNLNGPSLSIHTGCSTSLVAVCQAVDSLLSKSCDMAIAGGSSVTSPIKSGYLHQEGSMLSKDGTTRSFDESGSGTVFSDGAGAVILKRLKDAIKDGDSIYAVIRGAALNNDGAEKASFTAPSVQRQAEVIAAAQVKAGFAPSSIGYIETHGTATPIGDPVEIEALTLAFSREHVAAGSCAIGSIKSNIGHLTAAAGVAGLIKAALALDHKELPPSIYFDSPNSKIDLQSTPFHVQTRLEPWNSDGAPRRAGVSSFGVGGTNSHVVLEEAPRISDHRQEDKQPQLLILSAKTESALEALSERIASRLKKSPEVALSDVAYTLQAGRREFAHRRAVVVRDSDSAIAALSVGFQKTVPVRGAPPKIVFSFPGQGSQYVGMGADLYRADGMFRAIVDECCEILFPILGCDLRTVMMPESDRDTNLAAEALKNTFYTQPALFVIEYAMSRLLYTLGVRPDALVGHSVGEFVAATLAGVFKLEDALRLVAERGKAMSTLPAGSMLSIRASAERVREDLPKTLSIASVNSPVLCVVAGPSDEVTRYGTTLDALGVVTRPLMTSHAFHSEMMEPAVPHFEQLLREVTLSEPRIPIYSTVTGKVLTPIEACSPKYWADHLRVTVDFSGAIKSIFSEIPEAAIVEVGPRMVLSTLARQHSSRNPAVPMLSDRSGRGEELDAVLSAIAKLWTLGIAIDWNALHAGKPRRRVHLSTYPFERRRYWAEAAATGFESRIPQNSKEEDSLRSAHMNTARQQELTGEILKVLEDISGLELAGYPGETGFFEMGLDSLLLTQAATQLQRRFGVRVTFRQLLEEMTTPAMVASMLAGSKHGPVAPESSVAVAVPVIQQVSGGSELAAADPKSEPKPVFGAAARISTARDPELTQAQKQALETLQAEYLARTSGSKELTQKNRANLADPRVVSGFRPVIKEMIYPIVVDRSKGSKLWDVDGNEYVDFTCGFGSNFFGNSPEFIVEAVKAQLDQGYEIGPQHPMAGEVAKLFCEVTGLDRAALCNTGSEAVLGAMRLARTVTGRDLIVAFSGGYHGIVDEVIVRGTKSGRSIPAASGIPQSAVDSILILEYGSPEALETIRTRGHEIAGVLVESVQSRRPDFQPREFLKELRTLTQSAGSALIFDEVITGFRIHPGGAQAHFGIRADLATYGKIVGGGMPIGVIAGSRQFMDALDGGQWNFGDESTPTVGVTYFAGTFVRHPLALAAAKAVLLRIKTEGDRLQRELNAKADAMAAELNSFFASVGAPLKLKNFGSLLKPTYTEDVAYGDLLFLNLRLRGIHIWDARPCFLTLAHTQVDIQKIVDAFKESVRAMQAAGFLPSRPSVLSVGLTRSVAPVAGARLGRDPQGQEGWFIPDPSRPGKWLKLKSTSGNRA